MLHSISAELHMLLRKTGDTLLHRSLEVVHTRTRGFCVLYNARTALSAQVWRRTIRFNLRKVERTDEHAAEREDR